MSVASVTEWLRLNGFGATALELYEELQRCHGVQVTPLLEVAEHSLDVIQQSTPTLSSHHSTDMTPTASGTAHLRRGQSPASEFCLPITGQTDGAATAASKETPVGEGFPCAPTEQLLAYLRSYRMLFGPESWHAVVQQITEEAQQDRGAPSLHLVAPASLESSPLEDLLKEHEKLAGRLRKAENQVRDIVTLIREYLVVAVSAIEPIKKEALLPLLRTVAIMGESSTRRAAARQAILSLFRRPTSDQRATMTSEWLRVAQAAPRRSLEQEIIPELYGLVNARVSERRLLALDCGTAVAELIMDSAKVRHALYEGLLRPLSEDESSVVRRKIPVCLAALWRNSLSLTEDDDRLLSPAPVSAFPMELIIRLALDAFSYQVRRAAETHLREVIFPKCLQEGILLTRMVPLLLTFLGMEVREMKKGNVSPPSSGATGSSDTRMQVGKQSPTLAVSGFALTYSNVTMLVKLCCDALRCVRHRLTHLQEDGPPLAHKAATVDVEQAYMQVLIPTAIMQLVPFLNPQLYASSQSSIVGPLTSLGVELATLVPRLSVAGREGVLTRIRSLLLSMPTHPVAEAPPQGPSTAADFTASNPMETPGLLFFGLTILVPLAGLREWTDSNRESTFASQSVLQALAVHSPALLTDTRLQVYSHCLARLAEVAASGNGQLSAGILAVLQAGVESPQVTLRLHTVNVISGVCDLLSKEGGDVVSMCQPLVALVHDTDKSVKEMAVTALLTIAMHLRESTAQEKVLQPAICAMEAAGCASELTSVVLHHWEVLLPKMPAEHREAFLYPHLKTLMEKLSSQLAHRVAKHLRHSTDSTPRATTSSSTLNEKEQEERRRWEHVMFTLQSLLMAILRCAVVTPTLVTKYLLPGARYLGSDGLMPAAVVSAQLRTQWEQTKMAYTSFMESNSIFPRNQAATILSRVKDEWNRQF